MDVGRFDEVLRAVYCDPRFVAQVEWLAEYSLNSQLAAQWPREEMGRFVSMGRHADPDRRVSLVVHEMPDFGWWEPRYDQPGRRVQARYRELGVL